MTVTQSSTLQRDDASSCSRKKSVGADLINVGENCIILIKLSAPECATNANKQKMPITQVPKLHCTHELMP